MQYFWEATRIVQFFVLMYLFWPIASWGPIQVRLTAILTLSSITQFVLIKAMDMLFKILFGWESLSVMDSYFMIDRPESQTNVVAISEFEKFDAQKMKTWVHDKLCSTLPRGKKRLIQRFGRWYFEPMNDEEWESRFEKIVKIVPKVSTEEEFEEVLRELHETVFKMEDGQLAPFKIVLIEESHVPDRSYMIISIHHTFCDGIIWIGCLHILAENGFEGLAKFGRAIGFNPLLEMAGIARGLRMFWDTIISFDASKT